MFSMTRMRTGDLCDGVILEGAWGNGKPTLTCIQRTGLGMGGGTPGYPMMLPLERI